MRTRWIKHFASLVMVFGFITIVSAQDNDDGIIRGEASVRTVEVNLDAQTGAPTLQVMGNLSDSCTEIDEVIQRVEGDVIRITITTSRPANLMCAQVLGDFDIIVPIDTTDLEVGTYTLLVNGIQSELTITAPVAEAQIVEPTCPTPTEEAVLFRDDALSICFLYPTGYNLNVLDDSSIAISAPATGGTGASLLLVVEPSVMPDLASLETDLIAANDTSLNFETVRVGNQTGISTTDIPSRITSINAFVLYENLRYTFTIQPIDATFPEASNDAESVWGLVLETAIFGASTPDEVVSEAACSMPVVDEAAFIGGGLCFVYPAAFDLTESNNVVLVIDGTVTLRIQWRPSPGFTLAQVQESLEITYPNADLTFEPLTLGEVDALLTNNIPGARVSRQLNVIWQDQQYTLTLAPIDGNATRRAEALWEVVIGSLLFIDLDAQ